jgi:hypothetical protein
MERRFLFLARLARALRYYRRLHYSWRLAWAKAGWPGSELA